MAKGTLQIVFMREGRIGSARKVYVSAFPDFTEFKKHSTNIAWETEIWLVDFPEHMIHFNGDRLVGPR